MYICKFCGKKFNSKKVEITCPLCGEDFYIDKLKKDSEKNKYYCFFWQINIDFRSIFLYTIVIELREFFCNWRIGRVYCREAEKFESNVDRLGSPFTQL